MVVKTSRKQIKTFANKFISGVLNLIPRSVKLRSKEPCVCWKMHGKLSFIAFSAFSGFLRKPGKEPDLIRMRLNIHPPSALHFAANSGNFCKQLSFITNPIIATEPSLEVTCLPEEISVLDKWLVNWLKSYDQGSLNPPASEFPLISWTWNADLSEYKLPLTVETKDWKQHLYLWSQDAIEVWESFIASCNY